VNAHSKPQFLGGSTHSRGPTNATSSANLRPPARDKLLHLGVIRGGPELYPSVRGTITPVTTPSFAVNIDCLIDTGCLFSNFCKEAIARQLVDFTPIAANARRVVTLADGSTVSTVGSIVCNLRLTCDTKAVFLKYITMHILPELAFDVILGYPTIRKYELLIHFSSLFTGKSLQLHNCKSCRQCLPAVHQQECTPAAGATQSEVLLADPRLDTLAVARDCRRSSEGGLDVADIMGSPRQSRQSEGGLNVAAIRDSPREPQLDAATIQGATRESHRAEGGLGVATNQSATLRSHRHSEGGIDVASRQARDRQVQYRNAQQARLESEVERDFLSGSNASYYGGHELTDASDFAPVAIGDPGSQLTDIDSMLMLIISISGSANLQHRIRQLCHEYSDILPAVSDTPALVPPCP
jgi:hypothetical protein